MDMRPTERAYKLGLVKQDRYEHLCSKREAVNSIIDFTRKFSIKAALINDAWNIWEPPASLTDAN